MSEGRNDLMYYQNVPSKKPKVIEKMFSDIMLHRPGCGPWTSTAEANITCFYKLLIKSRFFRATLNFPEATINPYVPFIIHSIGIGQNISVLIGQYLG